MILTDRTGRLARATHLTKGMLASRKSTIFCWERLTQNGPRILSSPSSSATQHWDHHVAGVTTHSSASRQHEGILDDVDTHWLVNQDEPSSPQSQGPQGRNDLGPSVDEDAERPFEPNGNPTGFFGFSHDNNGLTDLGIDLQSLPLSLPLWDPISLYSESEFAYNTDTESGQEDTQ